VRVLVVTGRMFRSVRPYLEQAELEDPVVCYQGAAVVEPRTGRFLVHEPLPLDVAREAVAILVEAGRPPNCYVDDELYVAEHDAYSRAYAEFQHLPVTEVGDLLAWLERPPTKLVAVGDPEELPVLRALLARGLGTRASLMTSLPYLLEIGNPAVSKGTGAAHVAGLLGFGPERTVAFGDGENDVDLLAWASFGVAVEGSHPALRAAADWVCPGPDADGVARVIEAYLGVHSAA
jgi:Cof subfamily protein (haloacid dehalogenase superfamily)